MKERILKFYNDGNSIATISKKLKLSRIKILEILRNNNIEPIIDCKLDNDLLEKEYIKNNLTISEISNKYKIDKKTISFYLKYYRINKSKDEINKSRIRSIENTFMKLYGVNSSLKLTSVRNKIKESCLAYYGVDQIGKSSEVRNKIKATNLKKYNSESYLGTKDCIEKTKITLSNKYGVINANQLEETKMKSKQTCLAKFGVDNYKKSSQYKEKISNEGSYKFLSSKKSFLDYLNNFNVPPTIQEIAKNLDRSEWHITSLLHRYDLYDLVSHNKKRSSYEKEIVKILKSNGIKNIYQNDKRFGKELDIYLPDYNFAIEFNGDYWHSTKFKNKYWHQQKSLFLKEQGIFVFHIFEYKWKTQKEIIINELLNKLNVNNFQNISNYEVIRMKSKEKNEFLKKYSLYGDGKANVSLGIKINDELISVMTFRKKDNHYKISRITSLYNNDSLDILLNYFIQNILGENTLLAEQHLDTEEDSFFLRNNFHKTNLIQPTSVLIHNNQIFNSGIQLWEY